MVRQGESKDKKSIEKEKLKAWLVIQEKSGKTNYTEQYDAYVNGLNFFKNQVWVVIALCFTLFGAVMWLFEKIDNLPGGSVFRLKFFMSLSIFIIGLVAISLIQGFYEKIKKSRLFIEILLEKRGYVDIDDFHSDSRRPTLFRRIVNYRFFIELYFAILIILTAAILIVYIYMLSLPVL